MAVDTTQLTIRLPTTLYNHIQGMAEISRRAMNAQIVMMLENSIDDTIAVDLAMMARRLPMTEATT